MPRTARTLPRSTLLFAALALTALSCSDPSGTSAGSGPTTDHRPTDTGVTTGKGTLTDTGGTTGAGTTTDVGGSQPTTSTSATDTTTTTEIRSNDIPGQTSCPWDTKTTCKVLGPTLLDAPKKLARIQSPTSGQLKRVEEIQKRFPATDKALRPALPTPSVPHAPGTVLSAPIPSHALPTSTALPHTTAIPSATARPIIPTLPHPTGLPEIPTAFVPHGPAFTKCDPKTLFMCHPDILKTVYMTSFTVSTVDIEVLTFMKEYDKCAASKGKKTFLDLLLSETISLLGKKSYGTEGRLISQAQNKAEIQGWKGPSNNRELELLISQTAQEDGIVHLLYFPTSKDAFAPEMQALIDAIRVAADTFLVKLLTTADCPPSN